MKNPGMDRDIALDILDELIAISAELAQINDNEYVPHITVQPTDQTVALSGTCTFTVTANNVKSYQWQVKTTSTKWNPSTSPGYNTDTFSFTVSQATLYNYKWRCQITGKDNSVIYSNEVEIINPA